MKNGIHPQVNPVVFVDVETGDEIISRSTLTSQEKKEIDGVSYYVIRLDVTSFSHPFFTGEMRFVDRQGRVDKFMQRVKLANEKKVDVKAKNKVETKSTDQQSYQEILRLQQLALKKSNKKTVSKTTAELPSSAN